MSRFAPRTDSSYRRDCSDRPVPNFVLIGEFVLIAEQSATNDLLAILIPFLIAAAVPGLPLFDSWKSPKSLLRKATLPWRSFRNFILVSKTPSRTMRYFWFILMLATLIPNLGCYTNRSYQREISILRGEIIDLENKYYSIKSEYESAQLELDACRGCAPGERSGIPEEIFGQPGNSREELPKDNDDSKSLDPMIEDGDNFPESGNGNDSDDGLLTGPNNSRIGNASRQSPANPQSWIRKIRFDRELTRAQDFDGVDGDDGVLLVIQPLDAQGNVIPVAGKVIISILDPQEQGQRQRMGFYRLEKQDLEPLLETSEALGAGIHLRLEWNRNLPRRREVRAYCRFETEDGQRFEASVPIGVRTTPEQHDRWAAEPEASPTADQQRPHAIGASSSRRPRWRPRR